MEAGEKYRKHALSRLAPSPREFFVQRKTKNEVWHHRVFISPTKMMTRRLLLLLAAAAATAPAASRSLDQLKEGVGFEGGVDDKR